MNGAMIMILTTVVYEKQWTVKIEKLDEGYDISLTGGDRTHVGAVAIAEADGKVMTMEREGHKDLALAKLWAVELSHVLHETVCVRCGIHYDVFSKDMLKDIYDASEALLKETTAKLKEQ